MVFVTRLKSKFYVIATILLRDQPAWNALDKESITTLSKAFAPQNARLARVIVGIFRTQRPFVTLASISMVCPCVINAIMVTSNQKSPVFVPNACQGFHKLLFRMVLSLAT